jgi:uncharacterized membrane protein HdeD (DUF308 family)
MLITLVRNWWLLALRGVCAVLFGLLAFVWPGLTLQAIILLYGAYALVQGVLLVFAAVTGKEGQGLPWWALLLEGLLGMAAGIVCFVMPGIAAITLVFLIAGWAVMTGILQLIAAIRLRKDIEGEFWLGLTGVLSILFGLLLVFRPGVGLLTVTWLIGGYALVFGIFLIALAFRLKGFRDRLTASRA